MATPTLPPPVVQWPAYYYALLKADGKQETFRSWPSLACCTTLLGCDRLTSVAIGLLNHPPDDQVMLIDLQARAASKPVNPYATAFYHLLFPDDPAAVYGDVILTFACYFQ
jgi:hypothetical protein